jgi:hypothetical protein
MNDSDQLMHENKNKEVPTSREQQPSYRQSLISDQNPLSQQIQNEYQKQNA